MDTSASIVPRTLPLPLSLKVARVLLFVFGTFAMLSFLSQLMGWVFARDAVVEQMTHASGLSSGAAQAYLVGTLLWMLAYGVGQVVVASNVRHSGPKLMVVTCTLMGLALAVQISQIVAFGVPGGTGSGSEMVFALVVWLTFGSSLLIAALVVTPAARAHFTHNATERPTW
ncbi:hypothetical protein J4H86_14870 [Spiractinospora alimapuensis]|uniref:hypothetical protein n=1 Tax=Spiractinospora alimapuensis TaxID=2820884 RepID=UPI001F305DB6|nr:hypothetical protein [Spiractinospora alimapuensis]QVQ50232.1 hypothetical protein J4H86_14870 [Spiractinospora alimapuensis]